MVRRSTAVIVAVAMVLTMASPVAASTYIGYYDKNGNGTTDTWLVDDDGNTSTAERWFLDNNENGYVEMQVQYAANGLITGIWLDAEENGSHEILVQGAYASNGAVIGRYLWYDPNTDGRMDIGYYDGDLDGYYEWVCVDTDYDGVANQWTANTAPRGHTAVDTIARNVSFHNWVDFMHARGHAVFFPTVSVPLP